MQEKHDMSANPDISNNQSGFYNLTPAELIEYAIKNGEGTFTQSGALVVNTSPYSGRSPNDKYLVENNDPDMWLADGTQSISYAAYKSIKDKFFLHLSQKPVFIRDVCAGADRSQAIKMRVITDLAWHNLAAANMFIENCEDGSDSGFDLTLAVSASFAADPVIDGLRSPAFIIMNFDEKIVLIGTTTYGGEIKKSVFTFMNYLLPKRGVLSLHCSANKGMDGDVALFFGLSGTGKTTLSSDPERALIGDDEHGWAEDGVFNFEGGCYAKTIRINPEFEPLVWSAINRFGCLLENVPIDNKRNPDFNSNAITENTRASYPLSFISNFDPSGMGGHPQHIFFLTADAFGVLPPLAKLSNEQAIYYFLSGYTSKLAGTERGLGDKPEATFSTCFGAPFLPLKPSIYAELLSKKLKKHNTKVWLLNTGWTGGGYGVGKRFPLPVTRAIISAVLNNKLNDADTERHFIFNMEIPVAVPGVPPEMLFPERSWKDQEAYKIAAHDLAQKFINNFSKHEGSVPAAVVEAGPSAVND